MEISLLFDQCRFDLPFRVAEAPRLHRIRRARGVRIPGASFRRFVQRLLAVPVRAERDRAADHLSRRSVSTPSGSGRADGDEFDTGWRQKPASSEQALNRSARERDGLNLSRSRLFRFSRYRSHRRTLTPLSVTHRLPPKLAPMMGFEK